MKRRATDLVLYAFVTMLGLTLAVGLAGLLLLTRFHDDMQETYASINLHTRLANEMRDIVRDRSTRLHRIVLIESPAERAREIALNAALMPRFQSVAAQLAARLQSEPERTAYGHMLRLAEHGWRMQDEVLALLAQGDRNAAQGVLLNTVLPVQDEVLERFGAFNALQNLHIDKLRATLDRQYRTSALVGSVIALLSLFASAWITYVLHRRVAGVEADIEASAQVVQRYAMQLEARVDARTRDLVAARDEAIRANKAKGLFLANTSHELRTPLSAIIGYSEMMREEAEEARDTGYVRDLGKINQAARHLLELIDAILDLAKVEAGRMPVVMQSFDLPELIREVLDSIHPLAEKNRNTLEVDTSAAVSMIECDRTKLFQILLNLLANACKFTEDGHVRLSAGGSREAGWRFVVADTGIGMTPEAQRDIFQPFVQADASTTRRFGGTGLGLALVREYVTLLDGDIHVHSVPGQGTRFTLRLPGRRTTPGAQSPQT